MLSIGCDSNSSIDAAVSPSDGSIMAATFSHSSWVLMHKFCFSFSCAQMKQLNTSVCFVLGGKWIFLYDCDCFSGVLVSPPWLFLCPHFLSSSIICPFLCFSYPCSSTSPSDWNSCYLTLCGSSCRSLVSCCLTCGIPSVLSSASLPNLFVIETIQVESSEVSSFSEVPIISIPESVFFIWAWIHGLRLRCKSV